MQIAIRILRGRLVSLGGPGADDDQAGPPLRQSEPVGLAELRAICSGVCRRPVIVAILLHPLSWAIAFHHEWTNPRGHAKTNERRIRLPAYPA